jgi:hypothetical protein
MAGLLLLVSVLGMSSGIVQPERDRAIRLATETLARHLDVAADKIRLVRAEAVDWPNSSLGCPKEGMSYMQVIVPGFRVRLAVGDREHAVHTGGNRAIVCESAARTPPPSQLSQG